MSEDFENQLVELLERLSLVNASLMIRTDKAIEEKIAGMAA